MSIAPSGNSVASAASCRESQRGVTSIEYALIASLIAVVIVGGVAATGDANGNKWAYWTGKVIVAIQTALGV